MAVKRDLYRTGRLTARYTTNITEGAVAKGIQRLPFQNKKESIVYIPQHYTHGTPAALALMLHGAGGDAGHGLSLLKAYADMHNIIILAPASQAYSWDIIAKEAFGTDVILLDQALAYVFEHYNINPAHMAIGGFSDGASYALSIGLSNGDLFTHIIAFSPGFYYTVENWGQPGVFISHGTKDGVLPIEPCSRRIVPRLRSRGIAAVYHEFNGEHTIPDAIAKEAVSWFLTPGK